MTKVARYHREIEFLAIESVGGNPIDPEEDVSFTAVGCTCTTLLGQTEWQGRSDYVEPEPTNDND